MVEDRRPLGTPEVQAIADAQRAGAGARDVAGRLRNGRLAPFVRVEQHVAAVAVHRHRQAKCRIADPNHSGVTPRADHGACLDGRVVLLVDPVLRCDGRVVQQREKDLRRVGERGEGRGTLRPQTSDRVVFTSFRCVDRTVVEQPLSGDFHHDLVLPFRPVHPVVGHPADRRGREVPLLGNRLDLRNPVGRRDDQHALLRFGQ